jgi:hypothetical protein
MKVPSWAVPPVAEWVVVACGLAVGVAVCVVLPVCLYLAFG